MTRTLVGALMLTTLTPAPIFRFEADGFWLNLHHFLYVLGRAQNKSPDLVRRAVVNAPADQQAGLNGVTDVERQTWAGAVTFYANGLSTLNAVFDSALIDVTKAMRVRPNAVASALKVDPGLQATLAQASSVYRKVWWPRHQRANDDRVRHYASLLEQHGDKVCGYITRAYLQPWPKDGFLINVSGYTNWAGAYSTDGGLIVISSLDEGTSGSLGLESIFHEAMHQWDEPMLARLARLAKEHGMPSSRENITHALIWYTAAEAVRSVIPGHVGYAERGGMWKQKGLGSFRPGLDAHWKPYLDGKGTLDEALRGVLKS
jgi:hypothetical protein